MHHHIWLIFAFFVETGSQHVAQAGFKLLGSGDPLASASQSIGMQVSATMPGRSVIFKRHGFPRSNFVALNFFFFFFETESRCCYPDWSTMA